MTLTAGFLTSILVVTGAWTPSNLGERVTVQVVDKNRDPIEGATVKVLTSAEWPPWEWIVATRGVTDKAGRYVFLCPSDRGHVVVAQAEGFAVAWNGPHPHASSLITLKLHPGGSIQGRVVDDHGRPVTGALVVPVLFRNSPLRPTFGWCEGVLQAHTDNTGLFTIDGLPKRARVELKVSHPEYAPAIMHYIETDSKPYSICGQTKGLLVEMEQGPAIRGRITFEGTGEPAVGAEVRSCIELGKTVPCRAPISAVADADGYYTLRVPGSPLHRNRTYTLSAKHPESPVGTAPSEVRVPAPKYGPSEGNDMTVQKGKRYAGRFVNAETGEPLPGSRVQLSAIRKKSEERRGYDPDEGRRFPVPIEPDGSFSFYGRPGLVELEAFCLLGAYGQVFPVALDGEATGRPEAPAVAIPPPQMLRGEVVGPDGQPLAGAVVLASSLLPNWSAAVSAQDGSFEVPVDAFALAIERSAEANEQGAVEVTLKAFHKDSPGHRALLTRRIAVATGDLKPDGVSEAADEPLTLRLVPIPPDATISGRVVDSDGLGIRGAQVTLSYRGKDVSRRTDADGRYAFAGIVGGAPCQVSAQWGNQAATRSRGCTVTGGEERELLDLVIPGKRRSVTGIVVDRSGTSLPGMHVLAKGPLSGMVSTKTGPDGRFKLNGLAHEPVHVEAFDSRPDTTLQGALAVGFFQHSPATIVAERR